MNTVRVDDPSLQISSPRAGSGSPPGTWPRSPAWHSAGLLRGVAGQRPGSVRLSRSQPAVITRRHQEGALTGAVPGSGPMAEPGRASPGPACHYQSALGKASPNWCHFRNSDRCHFYFPPPASFFYSLLLLLCRHFHTACVLFFDRRAALLLLYFSGRINIWFGLVFV